MKGSLGLRRRGQCAKQGLQVARGLNVVWFLGSAVLTLLIARELFPRNRLLQLGSLVFACFVPVSLKLAAMFHPETLSLFGSTLALYAAVLMFTRRKFGWRSAVGRSTRSRRTSTAWITLS